MHSIALKISTLVAVATAFQIQSNNSALQAAGKQGCISASSNTVGAPVVIHDCNTEEPSHHNWDFTQFTVPPQPLKVFGDKCLDVTDGINIDGTKLQIWTCVEGSRKQQWFSRTDFTFQWAGTNKCIDLTDGNITDGTQLQIWTCDSNNSNQKWTVNPVVTQPPPPPPPPPQPTHNQIYGIGGPQHITSQCITASVNADGARVALSRCVMPTATFPDGNYTWVVPSPGTTGQIKTFDGTKCLDVRDGSGTNGNKLQIWSCIEGNTNQLWNIDIDGPPNSFAKLISWAGESTKCVDIVDGRFEAGNDLQIWDCDVNNRNQWWSVTIFE